MKKTKQVAKCAGSFSLILMIFLLFVPMALGQTLIIDLGGGSSSGWDPDAYDNTDLPSSTVADIVSNIAMWLLGIFGFIGVIGFVISGILYLTAAGDAEQEKKAKKAMTMSIIGVIVGLSGLVIIKAVDLMLGGTNSTF